MEIDTKTIDEKNQSMIEKASAIIITDDDDMIIAGKFLRGIKAHVKSIKAVFAEPKQKAKAAHDAVCNLEKKALGFTVEAEACIKRKISNYVSGQERIEKEKAAKLAAEIKAQAEKDALEMAENLEKNGLKAEADMALEVASAPVVVPVKKAPKVQGISYKNEVRFEIENDDLLPRNCTSGDKKKIKAQIVAGANSIPGVKIWTEKVVVARA